MKDGSVGDRVLVRRLRLFAVALCAALAVNNALPYVGMRDDSCQTMFSGLDWGASTNNHVFVPQRPVSDLWRYYRVREVAVDPLPPEHGRAADLGAWLEQPDRLLNDEAIRVVVDQLCADGHRVSFERRPLRNEPPQRFDDACAEDALAPRWWIPVRLYEPDIADGPTAGLLP